MYVPYAKILKFVNPLLLRNIEQLWNWHFTQNGNQQCVCVRVFEYMKSNLSAVTENQVMYKCNEGVHICIFLSVRRKRKCIFFSTHFFLHKVLYATGKGWREIFFSQIVGLDKFYLKKVLLKTKSVSPSFTSCA